MSEGSGSPRVGAKTWNTALGGSPLSPQPDSAATYVGTAASTSLFKDEPDVARNREKVTFLSLPCKNNGKAPEGGKGVVGRILGMKGKDVGSVLWVLSLA
jgi:hypothetical protein